ncbi:CHAD domain-containing protein, partial [Kibdelosporangium lantanae]
ADAPVNVVVTKPYRKLRKAVRALGEDPADNDLHALRIKGKRLRYAAELVGSSAKGLVKATRGFQEVLGEHQDAAVAEETIRRLLTDQDDPQVIFVAGRLVEREHARRLAYRAQWRDKWAAVDEYASAYGH